MIVDGIYRWRPARVAAARTRRAFKVALVLLLALFNLAAWLTPQGSSSDLAMFAMRGVLLAEHRPLRTVGT